MDELIKRLRNRRICIQQSGSLDDFPLLQEAADVIEELSLTAESYKRSMEAWADEAANAQPRWIPVTEALPSYGDWVLGIGPKKGYYVCEYRGITHCRRDGYDPWFSAKGSSVTITHWMPLPEPPKEEGE